MTTPTPQDHIDTTSALLAQSNDEDDSGQVVAARSTVARAQVHALLAIAALLAEANALATPAPTPDPEPTP